MATNTERATEVIKEAFEVAMSSDTRSTWAYQIAQALDADGLLKPNFPEPDQDGEYPAGEHYISGRVRHQLRGEEVTRTATVVLFKDSGKYYTEESWRVPEDAIGPYDMDRSPDFRRIGHGAVLICSEGEHGKDENWGFPHLFNAEKEKNV